MWKLSWCASTATALLLFALVPAAFQSSNPIIANTSKSFRPSAKTFPPTCPSRSLNYVTQTLPQQCLTTKWAGTPVGQETSVEKAQSASGEPHEGSLEARATSQAATISNVTVKPDPTVALQTPAGATPITSATSGTSTPPSDSDRERLAEAPPKKDQQVEVESPLDKANFLSFEEWKRQNLAKAGQSAENLGARAGSSESGRRPNGINNALDSLGEDTEIEIDFGGFVSPGSSRSSEAHPTRDSKQGSPSRGNDDSRGPIADENTGARGRSSDAGKTCKERSNYASFDCAATMLKTNVETKGANSVLVENRDTYMLNVCSAKNKFFIVELCDDILIDTIVLANFEFFSSMIRTFRVSVSDRYPVKLDKWKNLGTFEARNSREVQAFLIENPLIWARYVRIELLTHFGNEYYCPLSLLRVHGTTMMEEFNRDLKRIGTEDEGEDQDGDSNEEQREGTETRSVLATAERLRDSTKETSIPATETIDQAGGHSTIISTQTYSFASSDIPQGTSSGSPDPVSSVVLISHNFSLRQQMEGLLATSERNQSCRPEEKPTNIAPNMSVSLAIQSPPVSTSAVSITDQVTAEFHPPVVGTSSMGMSASTEAEASLSSTHSAAEKSPVKNVDDIVRVADQTSAAAAKSHPSSTQPASANPTTQESFFRSVHKRLQLLESNSTLSLQYIEEQSRILRDAFSVVEKRQLAKTSHFLESLNATVLTELRDFRNQYDQIWQSTVLELSSQREQSQHEVLALSARLTLLADEIVFHKRMAILQFILILLCLGLAIFSRTGSTATYLELLPTIHNAINRSSVNLSNYTPQLETPPASPSSARSTTRNGLFRGWTHQRGLSDESQANGTYDGSKSPSIECSPPTPPISHGFASDGRNGIAHIDGDEDVSDESPLAGEGAMREVRSCPATPNGPIEEQSDLMANEDVGGPQ